MMHQNPDAVLNDIRKAMIGLAEDFGHIAAEMLKVKDQLDAIIKQNLDKNQALQTEHLKAAMHSLMGSDNVPAAKALDKINHDMLERQKKLRELGHQLTLIQGEKGTSKQYKSLSAQLTKLNNQNQLAKQAQDLFIKDVMNRGDLKTNPLAPNQLQQAYKALQLLLSELNVLNNASKKEFGIQKRLDQQPPAPSSGPKVK